MGILLSLILMYVLDLNIIQGSLAAYFGLQIYCYLFAVVIGAYLFMLGNPENFNGSYHEHFLKDWNELLISADDNNNIIGCISATKENEDSTEVELRRMRVSRQSRGSGLAQKLIERAEAFSWSRDEVTKIKLITTADQKAAVKLYQKNGYRISKMVNEGNIGFLPGLPKQLVYMYKNRHLEPTCPGNI